MQNKVIKDGRYTTHLLEEVYQQDCQLFYIDHLLVVAEAFLVCTKTARFIQGENESFIQTNLAQLISFHAVIVPATSAFGN